jgi:hypothetical protein
MTGEDVPMRDAAGLARMVLIQFPWAQQVAYAALRAAQANPAHLNAVGAAFVRWLAGAAAQIG